MAALRATNIFSKNSGRASRDRYFLQIFTWLSKFHLPPVVLFNLFTGVQSNLMIFELYQPNWRPATVKNS
jgi:hypothetical protein